MLETNAVDAQLRELGWTSLRVWDMQVIQSPIEGGDENSGDAPTKGLASGIEA